ncbi:MAG: STAS domain-containing protein [Leptospirales bacterium]|jgi:anti-sigma B factor antagonist
MEIRQHERSDAILLEVVGEIDLYNADVLKTALIGMAQKKADQLVVVDLAGVSYIDSSGIGALISGKGALEKAGCAFALCSPAPSVRTVMRITKLLSFFQVYESEKEALQAPRQINA